MSSIGNTARAGNVLVLLDLYASGFASATTSPTIPMLTSRTMHSLYAISLLIYSLDSLLNWVHVYHILQGALSSFPLRLWFVLLVVGAAVSGSMLILMLVVQYLLVWDILPIIWLPSSADALHRKCLRPSAGHCGAQKWTDSRVGGT
jgi:hypothetical protein